jgi:phosphopentomutase
MDSVGIGALPDAAEFGDAGTNTLGHLLAAEKLELPNLRRLGMGNILMAAELPPVEKPEGSFGRAAMVSRGKDTTVGHWEMTGVITRQAFPTYPDGFPDRILEPLKKAIGRDLLGNISASGTEIIQALGAEHVRTGNPIVYTSADSVFQVAAHEEVIPLEELYKICATARGILTGPDRVSRVIARPFIGVPGKYIRTGNRKDFSVSPPEETLLDRLETAGLTIVGIGKIASIFNYSGITVNMESHSNPEAMDRTIEALQQFPSGFIFANLGDFDTLWGHRRDKAGYAKGLEYLDSRIAEIREALQPDDCLILTADHGCDPTARGTDHTREYVPVLVYSKKLKGGVDLGTRETLADVGQTVADNFNLQLPIGASFLEEIC